MEAKATIFDVAKYILEKLGETSTWKLQKLCYYSQAWHLAWENKPIFDEDFEAWVNGPVCPELFREHKGKFCIDASDLSKGNTENLMDNEIETIDVIIKDYGGLEAHMLREMTHDEKPWQEARKGYGERDACNVIITKDSMGEYYGSL